MQHTKGVRSLGVMIGASFVAMYALMYLMVDKWNNVFLNLDQFYMVVAMTAAMVIIELTVMYNMYEGALAKGVMGFALVFLIVSIILVRTQIGIGDKQFLKAMISHHGAAILMCQQATLEDPEDIKLCGDIVSSQSEQIDWMKQKLSSL